MEDLKDATNVQPEKGTATNVIEMTPEEFERKIETDNTFANDYLKGNLKIDESKPEPAATPEPKVEPAKAEPAKAPEVAKTPEPGKEAPPEVVKNDDGKFEVEFEDGRKIVYKSRTEALKGIREKELMINRQKETIRTLKERDEANRKELEALKSAPKKTESPEPAKPKAVEPAGAEEPLDPFDPEYQKKLLARIDAQDKMLADLKAEREADKAEAKKRDEESDERARRETFAKSRYSEANMFVRGHKDEFDMGRPVEEVDREYRTFIEDLGELAGTDGTDKQNIFIAKLYFDPESDKGKKLKEEAEKIGVRPPADTDKFFKLLRLVNMRLKKEDPDTGESIPLTLEEKFKYQKAMESDGAAPPAPVTPGAPSKEAPAPTISPLAQAREKAEELRKTVAADMPPGSATEPVSYADMTQVQLEAIIDMPLRVARSDPTKRKIWEGAFRFLKQTPPRLDGI